MLSFGVSVFVLTGTVTMSASETIASDKLEWTIYTLDEFPNNRIGSIAIDYNDVKWVALFQNPKVFSSRGWYTGVGKQQ